jgi:hypothetical protein
MLHVQKKKQKNKNKRVLSRFQARIAKIITKKSINFYFNYSFFYTHPKKFSFLLSFFLKKTLFYVRKSLKEKRRERVKERGIEKNKIIKKFFIV